jgi:predicted nucleic acid-binding protein
MAYLLDTNILVRCMQPSSPEYQTTIAAIEKLSKRGEETLITAQTIVEFWSVATRPADQNGLGLTPSQADVEVRKMEALFALLPDVPGIYSHWRRVVVSAGVSGRQVHDARLVAVMLVHGVTHLLTLNTSDFKRYRGIVVVHPRNI